jgi:predicted MPP superfamily phosphohydrolase
MAGGVGMSVRGLPRNFPMNRLRMQCLPALVALCLLVQLRLLAQELALPNRPDSVKFAAMGDNGTGDQWQFDVANQMNVWHLKFPYDQVIMLGDNVYGGQQPADFQQRFERPYKPLLDAGVKFYATLGNHDDPAADINYPLFDMAGQRYYTYARKNVRFFVLDSNHVDPKQLAWIDGALKAAVEPWKVCYFHHPLYSDGGRHGSEIDVRVKLEPLFIKYGVNVVYSGHDHIYERIKPQQGIYYFVSGAGGQLREGNTRPSAMTAVAFDKDRSFMLNEIAGDDLVFQVISRTGQTVDRGTIHRNSKP